MKKILKQKLTNLAKKNLLFRNLFRKILYIYRYIIFKITTIGLKVDNKIVIFGCFGGKSYTCSPKAIYEYMLADNKYNDYTFIWSFKEPTKYEYLLKNKNTIIVKQASKRYYKYLAKAKYWIFNYKIAEHIYPKKNQVFLQCWHGTPLKRLGCDLIHFDNALNTIDAMKKRYKIEAKKFSYFISPSKFATEKFRSAWNLKEVGKENIIIEQGYPRNDFLFNYTNEDVQKIKRLFFMHQHIEEINMKQE